MHNEDLIHIGGYDFVRTETLANAYREFEDRLRNQLLDEVNIPGDLVGIVSPLATAAATNRLLFGTPLTPRRAFMGHRREDALGVSVSAEWTDEGLSMKVMLPPVIKRYDRFTFKPIKLSETDEKWDAVRREILGTRGPKSVLAVYDEIGFIKGLDRVAGPDMETIIASGRRCGKSWLQRELMEQLVDGMIEGRKEASRAMKMFFGIKGAPKMKLPRAHTVTLSGHPIGD